jgi:uncharacterized protein (TIGR03435 family)
MVKSRALGAVAIVMVVCASASVAQSPAAPTFAVVSVKQNVSSDLGFKVEERQGGGLSATNVPAAVLIARAYPPSIPADIRGLPDWANKERYDVTATASLVSPTPNDRAAMLRAMLAERFKLAVHFENQSQPAYDLVLLRQDGRLGPNMAPTEVDCAARIAAEQAAGLPPPPAARPPAPISCALRLVGDRLEGDATMDNLANMLRIAAGRSVVNKTGLTGFYRVNMTFDVMAARRVQSVPDEAAAPSVFTALQEQLGLKLEPQKEAQPVLVIDHVEHPTEN